MMQRASTGDTQGDLQGALGRLLGELGLRAEETGGAVSFTGREPVLDSPFRLCAASAVALMAEGVGVAALWRLRSGRAQQLSIDLGHATAGLSPVSYLLNERGGKVYKPAPAPLNGFFPTADGRYIYLASRNYPKLNELVAALGVLDCPPDRAKITRAVAKWRAEALEDALAERRAPAAIVRSREEWLAHPQGSWLAERPVIDIQRIADGAPQPLGAAERPLAGVRVLDLTHVIAGPTLARTLAEQGADVLHISPPYIPDPPYLVLETGFGKRNAYLDLDAPEDARLLEGLAAEADIVIQSFRTGALERRGLSAEKLAKNRRGLIYVSLTTYGDAGPWAARGAYDPVAQAAAGLAAAHAKQGVPATSPAAGLTDYVTAYLGAAGALAALVRRTRDGGSYHVRVSLARTSMWIPELGRVSEAARNDAQRFPDPKLGATASMATPFGVLRYLLPVTQFSETRAYWSRPPEPPGASQAVWLPRASGVGA